MVTGTLRSGWLTLGPQTRLFEKELERYLGARHVVAVNSCSSALFLALKALGVGPGQEVITSSLTFASTVQAIMHVGARPVLADIEMETFGPAPDEFSRKTRGNTTVYLPVHFGGQACRIEEIADVARSRNIRIVEDAAHSFGATVAAKNLGVIGDATAFSFYATKNLTCGEGGCLATQSEEMADRFRTLSYHGMSHGSWNRHAEGGTWFYNVEHLGHKFNMSDVLSALGLSQLRRIEELLARRRKVAQKLAERLSGSRYFDLPGVGKDNGHTWHLFVVLINLDAMTIDRDHFIRAMAAENIGCSVHFIPIYKHRFYESLFDKSEAFPNCETYYSRCVSLPIFPDMSDDDIDDAVRAMNRIAGYYSKDSHAD